MNTHTHPSTKIAGSAFLSIGAVIVTLSSGYALLGSISGQGSSMVEKVPLEPMLIQAQNILPAAPEITQSMGAGMIPFGMLMMLLGFGLHAFIVLRNQEEQRNVPVHIADPAKKKVVPTPVVRKTRKPMEVIWVERTIRF